MKRQFSSDNLQTDMSLDSHMPSDIFGFKVQYVDINKHFKCVKNKTEGSNNNKICDRKANKCLNNRYYTKEYAVYYAIDMLHNISLLDLLDFKYAKMEIWIDPEASKICFASPHYEGFMNIHNQADKKDYAIDIVLTPEQKIDYLAASFLVGDLHTDNLGVVNGDIVVIDYDDWVMKTTEHFLTWGIEFLDDYSINKKYLLIEAGEFVATGYKLEAILSNQKKLDKLKKDFNLYYGHCQATYRHKNIDPFEIVVTNGLRIAECLKTFSSFPPKKILTKEDIGMSCLDPAKQKFYTKGSMQYKYEEGFFSYAQKHFNAIFARDFL